MHYYGDNDMQLVEYSLAVLTRESFHDLVRTRVHVLLSFRDPKGVFRGSQNLKHGSRKLPIGMEFNLGPV